MKVSELIKLLQKYDGGYGEIALRNSDDFL